MLLGGCYCGAVRYVIEGDVFYNTICHCSDCRRIAGALAVAWFSARMEGFRSSKHVLRGFAAPAAPRQPVRARVRRAPDELVLSRVLSSLAAVSVKPITDGQAAGF